jgi:hypothetical protein
VTLVSTTPVLLSKRGALLLFPVSSMAMGSVAFSCKLAVEGDESPRGKVPMSSPELSELLAVVDNPVECI